MKKKIMIALGIVLIVVVGVIAVIKLGGFTSRPDGTADTMELSEVSGLVLEKGYTQEEIEEKLKGEHRDNILVSWGKPDGMLSGMWGDVWFLDTEKDRKITLYYDAEGYVENVRVGSVSEEKKLIYGDMSVAEEIGITQSDMHLELNSIAFSELAPGEEEKYFSDYYITGDDAWLDYTITYESSYESSYRSEGRRWYRVCVGED